MSISLEIKFNNTLSLLHHTSQFVSLTTSLEVGQKTPPRGGDTQNLQFYLEDDLVFKTVLVVLLMSSDRILKVFLPTFFLQSYLEDDLIYKITFGTLPMSSDNVFFSFWLLFLFSKEKVTCGIMDLKELMENKHE